jgi:glycerol-3-phosphate O-acyltransferase
MAASLALASAAPPEGEEAGAAAGKIPAPLVPGFLDFYANYRGAVLGSGRGDETVVASVMCAIADRVLDQFVNPYTFPSLHTRITAPYDYYAFGQAYVRNLVDYSKSLVGNLERFDAIEAQLAAGENVVLLANHQTEADPAVWALLLEATHPRLATDVAYVAGDRVVTDPLCKPFSMGRNLFCVHSKKYMDVDPAAKEDKMKTNRKTVAALGKALGAGGQLLWIAPSGGRDRPSEAGEWAPAPFDPAAVELMRALTAKAAPRGHLWPLAMESGQMMPPPPAVVKEIGERRLTHYVGVGIALGPELDVEAATAGLDEGDKEARAVAVARAAYAAVAKEYAALRDAVAGGRGAGGAFSQPWAGKGGAGAGAAGAPAFFF